VHGSEKKSPEFWRKRNGKAVYFQGNISCTFIVYYRLILTLVCAMATYENNDLPNVSTQTYRPTCIRETGHSETMAGPGAF